jgi:hypothetical protein
LHWALVRARRISLPPKDLSGNNFPEFLRIITAERDGYYGNDEVISGQVPNNATADFPLAFLGMLSHRGH